MASSIRQSICGAFKWMKLVIFDLDGTLTRTNSVDTACFVQAFADALDVHEVNTNWAEYQHVTDLGCLEQTFVESFNRPLTHQETFKFIRCFLKLMRERHAGDASLFAEIAGASSMLASLRQNPEWRVAIATGCWKASARFKIQAAGLTMDDLPAAFAEDGPSREAIVQTAIGRAGKDFERIVSVGDATWDVQTASRLELPFVGIGAAQRAERLRQAGASHTMDNFLDQQQFMRYIEQADIPAPALKAGRR